MYIFATSQLMDMVTEIILTEARAYFDTYYLKFKSDEISFQKSFDLKKNHTLRVVENMNVLTKVLFLNEEQKAIAEIIALFHDAGRFPQYAKYGTFNDTESEDHALLSSGIIEEAPFFAKIDETSQQIIKTAIINHSKIQLPKLEEEQVVLFCQLIRDADKLDVLEMVTNQFRDRSNDEMKTIMYNLPNQSQVSEKIIKSIQMEKLAKKEDMKTQNDFRLMLMSWVFDLNYKASFNILNQNRYIEKIYNTLPKQDGIINAYRTIKLFIENKFVD